MDGEYVLAEAVEAYRGALGDRLLAAYALGSLAHGGFSELVSDVDLGLIVSDPIESGDGETIEAIADAEKGKGSPLHERLSVFWGTPGRSSRRAGRWPVSRARSARPDRERTPARRQRRGPPWPARPRSCCFVARVRRSYVLSR